MKGSSSPRDRAAKLLLGITLIQSLFFLFAVRDPWFPLMLAFALSTLWYAVMVTMPRFAYANGSATQGHVRGGSWLPALVLALAIFKIVTRSDVYFASFMDGFSMARQLVDERILPSGGSSNAAVNVFLTPLWINLVAIRGAMRQPMGTMGRLAITLVPIIALFDMLSFGGRIVFAFMMVLLYVAGILKFRAVAWVGLFFVGAFTYVQASRSSELYELGFAYLGLTASGGTLPPLRDLESIGMPAWFIGPLVFGQYIAHPITELVHLVSETPWWNPNFSTIRDQLAVLGIGNRGATQELLEQINPRFGTYQTFFGAFLVDFGLAGIGVALVAWLIIAVVSRGLHGQLRNVIVLLALSNIAVAPIENFFVVGGGFSHSILSILIALILSVSVRTAARA